MIDEELELVKPSLIYAAEIKAFRDEFRGQLDWIHGAQGLRNYEDPQKWLDYVKLNENEAAVPEGASPYRQFIYVRKADGKIVGMIGVRLKPVGPVEAWGGHVGYCVRPSERRKGYAKRMLKAVLPVCRGLGLERVMLTAGDENIGSVKTILSNGGRLESYFMSPKHNVLVGRYWIELNES